MLVTMEHLLDRLAREGGTIVSTASLSQLEIAQAGACGRMHVDKNSLGYVYLPPIDLKSLKANLIPGIGQPVFYYPKGDEIEKYGGATVLPAICLCSGDMAPELSIFTKEASMPVVVKKTVGHVNDWSNTMKLADSTWVYGAKGYWSISDKETK